MKTLRKRILALLLSVSLISATAISAQAYSRTDAINYSNNYALSYNTASYPKFSEDCTNYVSQCLVAGGMSMNSSWYCTRTYVNGAVAYQHSNAWSVADTLKNYLKDNGLATKIGSWSRAGSSAPYATYSYLGADNSSNLTSLNAGKVVIFYDWDHDGQMNHAAFFVKNNGASTHEDEEGLYGDLINQHSPERYHVIWHGDERNDNYRLTTRIYAFELN